MIIDYTTPEGRLRFYLQDTITNEGPLPDGRNFKVEEITELLDAPTFNNSVINGFLVLASAWRSKAMNHTEVQSRIDATKVADGFMVQAKHYQENPIDDTSQSTFGNVKNVRVDQYG